MFSKNDNHRNSLELSPPVDEAVVVQSMEAEVLTVKRRASGLKLQALV